METKIEWTITRANGEVYPGYSFNGWIGCTKVSPGCANCYAERQDQFRSWTPEGWGKGKPRRMTIESNWKQLAKWNRKAEELGVRLKVFAFSLADVFDPEVPDDWRSAYFAAVAECPYLNHLIVTKRPEHAERWFRGVVPPNIWLGTSVENEAAWDERVPILNRIPARVRFLSCEPLLEPIRNTLERVKHAESIDWFIVGFESGEKARPGSMAAYQSIQSMAWQHGTPTFFKQWGEWAPIEFIKDAQARAMAEIGRIESVAFGGRHDKLYRVGKKCTSVTGLPRQMPEGKHLNKIA